MELNLSSTWYRTKLPNLLLYCFGSCSTGLDTEPNPAPADSLAPIPHLIKQASAEYFSRTEQAPTSAIFCYSKHCLTSFLFYDNTMKVKLPLHDQRQQQKGLYFLRHPKIKEL